MFYFRMVFVFACCAFVFIPLEKRLHSFHPVCNGLGACASVCVCVCGGTLNVGLTVCEEGLGGVFSLTSDNRVQIHIHKHIIVLFEQFG